MNTKNYVLQIENPCTQDWTTMTATDKGKFCASCAKTVVDFTKLSDSAVLKIIKKTDGKICGRLRSEQLDRLLLDDAGGSAWASKFSKFLASLFLFASATADAQSVPLAPTHAESKLNGTQKTPDTAQKIEASRDSSKNVIEGKIIGQRDGEVIIGAYIVIKRTGKKDKALVHSDMNGNFKLVIPDSFLEEKMNFEIGYIGYELEKFVVTKAELPLTQKVITMRDMVTIMGDVYIQRQKKSAPPEKPKQKER